MKIAIVQEHVDTRRGGAETSAVELARHLAQLGPSVSVIHAATHATPRIDHNVTFLPIAVSGGARSMRTYRFVRGVQRFCRHESFDIIHAITPCLSANVYQPRGGTYRETVARSLAMVRPVWWRSIKRLARRLNVRQRFLWRIEETLLTKYAHRVWVAALSDYVRHQVAEMDFPEDRVRIVFNGVTVEPLTDEDKTHERSRLRATLGITNDQPLVLFAAHNFKLKGLSTLIRTMADPAGKGWTLVVAGRDNAAPYARLARRLHCDDRVHFVGATTPVPTWLAAADVLAHPAWYDPCSRIVLEAISLGVPAVTTRFNGAAEAIDPARHGAVVQDPGAVDELARAIATSLEPNLRVACAKDAETMRPRLSTQRHARELLSLYEDVLANT